MQHFLVVWDIGRYQRGAEIDSRVRKQYFVRAWSGLGIHSLGRRDERRQPNPLSKRARTRSPGHVVMTPERARPKSSGQCSSVSSRDGE